jgi:serine/threonine protein kinase
MYSPSNSTTEHRTIGEHSTSYTIRQRTATQKSETESISTRLSRKAQRKDLGDKDFSAQSDYDDLIRKSKLLPSYINLLQAASTYSRVRCSDFDFAHVSLTTAFFFERNVRRIGRGATYQVYKCSAEYFPRHYGVPFTGPESARSSGEFVVLKSIPRLKRRNTSISTDTERAVTNFIKELQVLGHPPLRGHPNIPNLLGIAWEDGADGETMWPVICIEYATLGTLAELQHSQKILASAEKNRILLDVGLGMEALKMCGIIHGDLKARNVLMFPHSSSPNAMIAKISDFADVWIVQDIPKDQKVTINRGTISSCSPEFESDVPPEDLELIDFYCYGLLVWRVLLDGQDPFEQYFKRVQQQCSKAGKAAPLYRHFILDTKNSERVLGWALDLSTSLAAEGVNTADITSVFHLTLQRDHTKRSRVWRNIYSHLQSDTEKKDQNLSLR